MTRGIATHQSWSRGHVRSLDKQAKAGASSGVGFGRLGWEIRQGERERERGAGLGYLEGEGRSIG
jgi:hypothetical protein